MHRLKSKKRWHLLPLFIIGNLLLLTTISLYQPSGIVVAQSFGTAEQYFTNATQETGVPSQVLKAICQMEGQVSMHQGSANISDGYGCMNLVHTNVNGCQALEASSGKACTHSFTRKNLDTLDQAAKLMNINSNLIKKDLATNILAGAWILRVDALALSPKLPTTLADWYGTVAAYSNATVPATASMYADAIFHIITTGFSAKTDQGQTVQLLPQAITPNTKTFHANATSAATPGGCSSGGADYSLAINCILDPTKSDCNIVAANQPCNYESANRPQDLSINQIVIHDVEGSALSALNSFQDPSSAVSSHYIIDTDGTVYEVLHNKDIAYAAGNYWYNQHSINIEHAGYDATGYQWYNALQYLASAKLVAFLIREYHIPLDHDHIVSHGTIPSSLLIVAPNHVDPGPYWLWQYYLTLIHQQGIAYPWPDISLEFVTIIPRTGQKPLGPNGTETTQNFNFFSVYNGPSTTSGLVPHSGDSSDITDETTNVESLTTYAYTAKCKDAAGTGDTMYQIWYGTEDQPNVAYPNNHYAHARQVWLAVPPRDALEFLGNGKIITFQSSSSDTVPIYGRPATLSVGYAAYQLGEAPSNAIFVSTYTVQIQEADGTSTRWYEINYNHRQAWIPSSEVKQ
jgi:N-acetylmuramoyl-L-alanine amidase